MQKTNATSALAALANDTRLTVFLLLVQVGPAGLSAGQISERVHMLSPSLSFHLNRLRRAGLVTFRREGQSLIYTAEYSTIHGLVDFLVGNCCNPTSPGDRGGNHEAVASA